MLNCEHCCPDVPCVLPQSAPPAASRLATSSDPNPMPFCPGCSMPTGGNSG
jgi:hypothetical protein